MSKKRGPKTLEQYEKLVFVASNVIQFPDERARGARLNRAAASFHGAMNTLAEDPAIRRSRVLGDELEAMLPPQALERARKR